MTPEIEKKVATLEGRMDSMKENHVELKEMLLEMRKESRDLPVQIGRQVKRAIKLCRANPPEAATPLVHVPVRDQAKKDDEFFDASKAWNKAIVTLILIIGTVVSLWANKILNSDKPEPGKSEKLPAITQEK